MQALQSWKRKYPVTRVTLLEEFWSLSAGVYTSFTVFPVHVKTLPCVIFSKILEMLPGNTADILSSSSFQENRTRNTLTQSDVFMLMKIILQGISQSSSFPKILYPGHNNFFFFVSVRQVKPSFLLQNYRLFMIYRLYDFSRTALTFLLLVNW